MPERHLPIALTVCLAAAGLPAPFAKAQAPAARGNPVDSLPAPRLPASPAGSADVRILTPSVPQQSPPSLGVTPLRFDIEGVQAISFDEVAGLFKPLVGQPVTVASLAEIARQVTAIYQQRGYALSFCYVPQQDFKNGIVRIVAVEGYVEAVQIEGEAGAAEPKIREIAERIRQNRPLQLASFERYTQLLTQLPGLRVEARALPPLQTDGAGSMVLKVARQPYLVSLGVDLRSSKPRAVVTGILNDPLLSGGRLSASTLLGAYKDETFGSVAYSQLVGSEGLTLKAEASLYRGNPDAHLEVAPAIQRYTRYRRAELSAQYPLILKRTESLFLSGGIYGVNNTDDFSNPANGARLTDEVKARAVYAQASYNTAREDQSQSLTLRLVHGLDSLGAEKSVRANVPDPLPVNPARLDFARILLEGSQRNRWGKHWGTAVSFATQYSPHILPSSERVSFGSTRFARGYAAGEVAGDSGWGLGLELNRSFALGMSYLKLIQPYVLLEKARVYSHAGNSSLSKLSSASIGVRLSDGTYYNVDLAASKPTGEVSPDNPARNIRLSAMVSYSLGHR